MDVHDDAHDDDGVRHDEDREDHPEVLPQAANRRRKLTSLMFAVLFCTQDVPISHEAWFIADALMVCALKCSRCCRLL